MKRTKRRYLALKIETEGVPDDRELMDAIWASVTKLYGEVGASLSGLVLIDYDVEIKMGVIRCSLISLPSIRASLAAITRVGGRVSAVHVLGVSGTIKALSTKV